MKDDMTLGEFIVKHRELNEAISNLVLKFEAETGVQVTDIDIIKAYTIGSPSKNIIDVKVKLP